MSGPLAALFILLGAVLTFPASLAVWEQRVLTNEDRFVELGQEVFQNEAVQGQLAAEIVEEIDNVARANNLSLGGTGIGGALARSQAEQLTQVVVGQLSESIIGRQVLLATHEAVLAVIDNDSERLISSEDEIRVNFLPAIEQVLTTFEAVVPQLRGIELPPGTGEVVIVEEQDLATAFQAARWFDGAAVYIALLPLVAFAIALIIATNRQQALFFIGLATVIVAGIRIALFEGPVRSSFTNSVVGDDGVRAAAAGVYDVFVATFVAQDMVLLAAGIAVIVLSIVWWGMKRTGAV